MSKSQIRISIFLLNVFIAITLFCTINMNVTYASYDTSNAINMIEFPDSFSQIQLIENHNYFFLNPKHHSNTEEDSKHGVCSTVALQLLLGYHNYYSDNRLIPQSVDGKTFLCDDYYNQEYNPKVYTDRDKSLGLEQLGTNDDVFDEIKSLSTLENIGLDQLLYFAADGLEKFVKKYYPYPENTPIECSSFSRETVDNELNQNRPVVLGTMGSNGDEPSFHVVVAYGKAIHDEQEGYIVHLGYYGKETKVWIPEYAFKFQVTMSVSHTHSYSPIEDQDGSSVVKNTHKILECSECHCLQVDELYNTNIDGNVITGLRYAPIKNVILPDEYNEIGNGAFSNTDIETLGFYSNSLKIGDCAFEGCDKLSNITSTSRIKSIGRYAFRNCENLTYFNISSSVTEIGEGAFAGCNNCDIAVASKNVNYCSENNIIYNKDKTIIIGSGKVSSELDLSQVQGIAISAFEGNSNLTKLIFDQIDIGNRAFHSCTNISEVYFDAFSVQQIGVDSFTFGSFTTYVPFFLQGEYRSALMSYSTNIRSREFNVEYIVDNEKLEEHTYYYGATLANLPSPNKVGYTFVGWHKDANLTDDIINDSYWQEKENVSLYAGWRANEYTISFEGICSDGFGNKIVTYNSPIGTLPQPTRKGYTFVGWVDQSGNDILSDKLYLVADNSVLTSSWKANTYVITFHGCGGTVDYDTLICTYDQTVQLFPNIQRDGYDFLVWNDDENGEGINYSTPFVYTLDYDLDLYAQWNLVVYSIIYNLNGGSNVAANPNRYTIESDTIDLQPATKTGHSFIGWSNNDNIISSIEKGSFGNISLDAQWQANTYNVELDSNGGTLSGSGSLNVIYGEDFTISATVSREGYDFLGWFDSNDQKYAESNGCCVKKWDKADNSRLIAQWSVKSYKIQINDNETITWLGAEGLSKEESSIEYGTAINLIADFKASKRGYKDGHIFDHFEYQESDLDWKSIPDLGENGAIITIIPVWVKESYTIDFDTLSGPDIASISGDYDDDILLPTVTQDGYKFEGWSETIGGEIVNWTKMPDLTPNVQDNGSTKLYANYSIIEYTITYELNGGTNADGNPRTYNVTQSIDLENPSKLGYTFSGWYLDNKFSTQVISITSGTGDKTLYAKWAPNRYAIRYYANNGTSISITEDCVYNEVYSLRANTFEKEGYHFVGWAYSMNGSVQFTDEANIMNLSAIDNSIVSLYAVWAANEYQVAYNANGGVGDMTNSSHVYDTPSNLNSCSFTRKGYNFFGWATTYNGDSVFSDGGEVENLTTVKNGIATLYAVWEPKQYKITFDMQEGRNGTTEVTVTYDAALPNITPPNRDGYIFKGYFDKEQANGIQYYTADNPSIGVRVYDKTEDCTLYAYWEKEYYDISIYDEFNMLHKVIQVSYGEQMPIFGDFAPRKERYTFDGYYTEKNGKGKKYYGMVIKNDEQTANIQGLQCYYRESISSIKKMDQYNGFSLYPHFLPLELDYTYNIYCNNEVISTQKIHISGKNEKTTVTAPSINGYSFDHFSYLINYTESSPDIPLILTRSTSNGNVKLDGVLSAVYTKDSCVTAGTLITLADGSQVPVETLTGNEQLLVWNMFTGNFDSAPIIFIDSEPFKLQKVIYLSFSDGTTVKVISEHAFWDIELNQYVYLDENAVQYLGHHFNKQVFDENGNMTWIGVQLIDVAIVQEETTAWSPVTYSHLCYYVNGMLSIPGGITGLFNYLTVDSQTMTIDQSALTSDIAEYGLFTFEEFSELVTITPEIFEAFNGQYLKIAIGKGMITIEDIQFMLNRYAVFF